MTDDKRFAQLVSLACHDLRTPLATVFGLFSIVYGVSALILAAQSRRVGNAAKRLIDSAA